MVTAASEISLNSEPMQPRILIADDQQDVLDALRLLLKGHGYRIETVNSPADLLAAVTRQEFDTPRPDAKVSMCLAACGRSKTLPRLWP